MIALRLICSCCCVCFAEAVSNSAKALLWSEAFVGMKEGLFRFVSLIWPEKYAMAVSPSSFEVSLDPFRARLLTVESDPAEADLWQLADLEPAPGYCGTLAARHRGWSPVWMARP